MLQLAWSQTGFLTCTALQHRPEHRGVNMGDLPGPRVSCYLWVPCSSQVVGGCAAQHWGTGRDPT